MATKKSQRYAIAIIAFVMLVGTIGSFAVMILSTNHQAGLQARYQDELAKYQAAAKEYEGKLGAQALVLSGQYYDTFTQFSDRVAAYDINSVQSLETEDLLVGEGEEIDGTTKFSTYYILWGPEGKVLEQSINTEKQTLEAPIAVNDGLDRAALIPGWIEGMKGMRLGGVRLLLIPSDKAYGETGKTDATTGKESIPPNTPLKFIVMATPTPDPIPQPDSSVVMKAYEELNK